MNFETHIQLSELLDTYGCLLTDRQRTVTEQYLYEDCSLQEIAEREGISRQAVRDALCTAQNKLNEYEAMLRFAKKSHDTVSVIDRIKDKLGKSNITDEVSELEKIWS